MSRRGGSVYEERDYYSREELPIRGPPVRTRERDREEIDIFTRREREPDRRPEFLRDDYGRGGAGPLVRVERETETITRPERRPRSPSPVRIRERFIERERSPSPAPLERVRTRVVERERSLTPPPPDRLRARVIETRERVRERSPSPIRYRERVIERERSPSPVRFRERIIERERSLSPPPIQTIRTRVTERETRAPSPSPSPSPPPSIRAPPIHQEIITHHRHIDHGFERPPAPSPPPPPSRKRETDIDIYTSKNSTEVDITRTSSRSERPPAPPAPRRYYDDDIYESERDRLRVGDTRIDISREKRSLSARPPPTRERERSRVRVDIKENESEADYYRKKAAERAYIGEAYNGATKDWAIVDVPPGTERVRMDGVGGGSEEITWQRYNGVRRSRFIPERERERDTRVEIRETERLPEPERETRTTGLEIEISNKRREGGRTYEREYERIEESSDLRVGRPLPPPKPRVGEGLWTEITKDLVVKEAIEQMGYDYEETEFFYYVLTYLRYEDVLQLVNLSESIRRDRRERIREIERERERLERRDKDREEWEMVERTERRRERDRPYDDERIIEREVIYDGRRTPRRGGGW